MKNELDTLFNKPVLSNGILGGSSFAVAAEQDARPEFVSALEQKKKMMEELNAAGFKTYWVHEELNIDVTDRTCAEAITIMRKYFPTEAANLEHQIHPELTVVEETMEFKQEDWDKLNEIDNS